MRGVYKDKALRQTDNGPLMSYWNDAHTRSDGEWGQRTEVQQPDLIARGALTWCCRTSIRNVTTRKLMRCSLSQSTAIAAESIGFEAKDAEQAEMA